MMAVNLKFPCFLKYLSLRGCHLNWHFYMVLESSNLLALVVELIHSLSFIFLWGNHRSVPLKGLTLQCKRNCISGPRGDGFVSILYQDGNESLPISTVTYNVPSELCD